MLGFDTETRTLADLMGNHRRFEVPRFQRDYSWTAEEREDLWLDLLDVLREIDPPAHYMGYLVLQRSEKDIFQIIDGQQRLTTLSIMIIAGLKMLDDLVARGVDAENNLKRIAAFERRFIGTIDPVTLISNPRLSLNRNNGEFFKDHLVPRRKLPRRGLTSSNRQLKRAFEDFYDRMRAHLNTADGAAIATFLTATTERLAFTVIIVNDTLNAFKVFETLNARGVRLSPTDLLKNHLFSVVYAHGGLETEGQIDSLESRWERLVSALKATDFTRFLRAYWSAYHAQVREKDLFKAIRGATATKEQVFKLLIGLEDTVDVFAAFNEPYDELWQRPQQPYLSALRHFGVTQPRPLLMVAHDVLSDSDFTAVLRACVIISVRFNVVGRLAPSEQEKVYAQVAQRIARKDLVKPSDIIAALEPIYVPDAAFRDNFSRLELRTRNGRNTKTARYLLAQLQPTTAEATALTLEHILPEEIPEDGWAHVDDIDHRRYRYRLGNMILLEAALNREAKQADFSAKQAIYARSQLASASALATQAGDWGPEQIDARQRAMARQATAVWRLPQLDR